MAIPTFTGATVDATGATLTLTFSAAAGSGVGFILASDAGDYPALAYSSGTGSTTLVYDIGRTIYPDEVLTLSYVPGDVIGLVFFDGQVVTNSSTVVGPSLWLDATVAASLFQDSALTTAADTDADPVGGWKDLSGNGNHVLQATAGKRPLLKLAIRNGLPVVRFDGTDDFLRATFTLDQPHTRLAVLVSRDAAVGSFIFIDGATDATGYLFYRLGLAEIYAGAHLTTAPLDAAAWHIWRGTFDSTSSKISINAAAAATGDAGSANAGGITLGAGSAGTAFHADCDIAEVMEFPYALSAAQVTAQVGRLMRKWGVGVWTLTSPTAYRVFQRSTAGTATITVAGSYTGSVTGVEARWNGGAWTTLTSGGGTFSGSLTGQPQGQGTLEVRDTGDTTNAAAVPYVGVGDVIVIAGQSNASGRGTNPQSYSHARLKAGLFTNAYTYAELLDPTDSNTGQVDGISSDASAAGSVWPLVATSIMAFSSVPVMFVPCAKGASTIANWAAGSNHQDRSTLYGSMVYRGVQAGGVAAVVWWQGEQDAFNSTTQAAYQSALSTLAANINTDLGCPLIVAALQVGNDYDAAQQAEIVNAQKALWGVGTVKAGPDLSGLTPESGDHFQADGVLATVADLWWTAIKAALGWAAPGGRTVIGTFACAPSVSGTFAVEGG